MVIRKPRKKKWEIFKKEGYVELFGSPFIGDLFDIAEVLEKKGLPWKGYNSGGGGFIWVKREDYPKARKALIASKILYPDFPKLP